MQKVRPVEPGFELSVPEQRALGAPPTDAGLLRVDLNLVRRVVWPALTALVVLDFAAVLGRKAGVPSGLLRFFDGDLKINFPTGYKTTFLLAVALLFTVLWRSGSRRADPFAPGWRLLAYVSLFAFVDETVYLHQSLSSFLHEHLHWHGVLLYSWTVIYAPAAAAVAVLLLRHVRHLDSRARRDILLSGGLYVVGALLFEPVKSAVASRYGDGGLAFGLTAAVSDSLELLGLTLLVLVLLAQVAVQVPAVTLAIETPRVAETLSPPGIPSGADPGS